MNPRLMMGACLLAICLSIVVLVLYYRDSGHADPAWLVGDWVFDAEGSQEQLAGLSEGVRKEGVKAIPAWERTGLSFTRDEMILRRGAEETRRGYHVAQASPASVLITFADGGDQTVFLTRDRVMWDIRDLRLIWKRAEPAP